MRIIRSRIRSKCEADENQYIFRHSLGTGEALFTLNILLQKCRDQCRDVFIFFVDYVRAFDRVQYKKLIEIIKNKRVDSRDRLKKYGKSLLAAESSIKFE